jgi:hypothetical protein
MGPIRKGTLSLATALLAVLLMPALSGHAAAQAPADEVIRVGIIGLDTSHSPAFTELINTSDEGLFGEFEVVAAYPKGSLLIESSYSRIPEYTDAVEGFGVEIVDSIEALLDRVDVVLLETNDGQRHLEQVLPVLEAGKPVFVDKPIAASLADAVRIFDAAEAHGVPLFSASSLRYAKNARSVRRGEMVGDVVGATTYSPATLEPHHPDLFWYGIHGVELLYTVMGTGCETVTRVSTEGTDVVVGTWADGRVGTFRGMRTGPHDYGGTAFGAEEIVPLGPYQGYEPLVRDILRFFETGEPPVSREETLEIYAFMAAADKSKRRGGQPVRIQRVLEQARAEASQGNQEP